LKLKLHFEQTNRKEQIPDTLERLKASVTEAFESAGNAVKDDAVKADVRETGRLFLDAMSASLAKASDNLRDRTGSAKPAGSEAKPADSETAQSTPAESTPAEPKPLESKPDDSKPIISD